MLVGKWRAEMDQRFGFELEEMTAEGLADLLDRVETDRLSANFRGVCSLERLRAWGGLEALARLSPRFDLVIVDEAHAFRNQGTRSNALGALLSDWADALIFLSATLSSILVTMTSTTCSNCSLPVSSTTEMFWSTGSNQMQS